MVTLVSLGPTSISPPTSHPVPAKHATIPDWAVAPARCDRTTVRCCTERCPLKTNARLEADWRHAVQKDYLSNATVPSGGAAHMAGTRHHRLHASSRQSTAQFAKGKTAETSQPGRIAVIRFRHFWVLSHHSQSLPCEYCSRESPQHSVLHTRSISIVHGVALFPHTVTHVDFRFGRNCVL